MKINDSTNKITTGFRILKQVSGMHSWKNQREWELAHGSLVEIRLSF